MKKLGAPEEENPRDHDQTLKARRYAELGIPDYWIVDPDALRVAFDRAEGPAPRRGSRSRR